MNVVIAEPPMFDVIDAAFRVKGKPVLFAFGANIYNPLNVTISPALFAHEAIHCAQQGGSPENWWSRYISDAPFRLMQEIEAHRAEFAHVCASGAVRHDRRRYLVGCAARLASPLYGALISKEHAKALISAKAAE